jgi:hypothetical protein
MRSREQQLPILFHDVPLRRFLPAALALATCLLAVPAVDQAAAQGFRLHGFGGNFTQGSHGNFHAAGTSPITQRTAIRGTSFTRFAPPGRVGKRVVGDPGRGQGGGKVTDGGRHPGGERHPRRPHSPRWPLHPSVVGVAADPGGGGIPPRLTGPSGGGGGSAASNQLTRGGGSGIPPANERRYVPDEVVLELAPGISVQGAAAVARRHRLVRLETLNLQLSRTTLMRWRIADRRAVPAVVRQLEADRTVISAQPNYLAALQQSQAPATVGLGDPAQYALAKLHMPQAHALATGDKVLIGVIDAGIDASHPEFAGMIVDTFDAIGSGDEVHPHGTGVAGAIVAHARLMGTAPAAQILAARAFGARRGSSDGTTFNILKALDWSVARGARIINMSFAGPRDPAVLRNLAEARAKGVILIAAAGNAGPKSPPLYPAADPNVIAVTATDENDQIFRAANQGSHIAVAAPGVDIFLPAPGGTYQMTSGTSFAAAEVTGAVALMLERRPELTPAAVRKALVETARDLGPKGPDSQFGAGLVDAYQAVLSITPLSADAAATVLPVTENQ